MYSLEDIEKKQNIKLPEEYKQLYKSGFNEIGGRFEIHTNEEIIRINSFLTVTEINDILVEFYDLFGYDIVPIAKTEYDDYICLYYRENNPIPSIVYWSYELAVENPEEAIFYLYDNIDKFVLELK